MSSSTNNTPTIAMVADGDGGAAVTVDGVPVMGVTRDGLGPVTLTVTGSGSTAPTVVRSAGAPATSGGGLTFTGDRWAVTVKGRPVIEGERLPGDSTTPRNVPPLIGQDEALYRLADALDRRRHVHLQGPTGCGKSTAVRLMAEARGWSFVGVTISPGVTAEDLLGGIVPVPSDDGSGAAFDRVDGPLAAAARLSQRGPTVLLLDEVNRIDKVSELASLYPVTDGQGYLLADGERIPVGDLVVVATSNPPDGDYIGTHALDPALSNRLGYRVGMDYPTAARERRALMDRVPGLDDDAARFMVDVVGRCRRSAEVTTDVGFRTLAEWADAVASGRFTVDEAAALSILPAVEESAPAVQVIMDMARAAETAAETADTDADAATA